MGSSSQQTTQTTSGGGSSTSTSTSTPYQQQYYEQLLGQANNLYENGPMNMYGGQTVANMTPAQLESMNLTSNWITGGAQNMMNNMQGWYGDMMSGRVNTGPGSPYGDMMNTYKNQAMDSANDMMQQVRSNQVMMGQPGGSSRGDLLNNQVINEANRQVTDAGAQMYGNAYNQAQQTRNNALSNYGSIMNMPLEMSKQLYNRVGVPQQQYNQAMMDDARQRYEFAQTAPWQHLAQYANMISGNFGGTNTSSSESGHHSTTSLV